MRDKVYSIIISAIFLVLLIWCPAAFVLDELDIVSLPENNNIKLPGKFYEGDGFIVSALNFIEEYKAELENIYANGLPMYEGITMFMLDSERSMRNFLLETLYSLEPEEPANDTAVVLEFDVSDEAEEPPPPRVQYQAQLIGTEHFNRVWAFTEVGRPYSEGWTDKTLLADEDELRRRVDIQLGHVNRIARAGSKVNFYVYVCTRFQETEIFGDIISDIRPMRGEISTKHLMDEFFDGLDKSAINSYDYFKIGTLEKRLEYIFRTDHHQSPRGAYSIYSDVINMIARDSPVIGQPHEAEFGIYEGIELRGSHVWGHGYTEIYDNFEYYVIDLPEHVMFSDIRGRGPTQRATERYRAGNFGTDTFFDHYAHYFPRPANVSYPGNNTSRNLLMLTDSYSWACGELIAAHFDNTYATLWTHGRFDYLEFIDEFNITDVLILQVADRILFDIQNDTQLDKVITD